MGSHNEDPPCIKEVIDGAIDGATAGIVLGPVVVAVGASCALFGLLPTAAFLACGVVLVGVTGVAAERRRTCQMNRKPRKPSLD